MVQGAADLQAFMDRLALFKARGGLQLEGAQHAVGDFRISLARAVQVCGRGSACLPLVLQLAVALHCTACSAAQRPPMQPGLRACCPPSVAADVVFVV